MATCFNKNLPEFKALKTVYKSDTVVNLIIEKYQEKNNTDLYPTPLQASKLVKETRTIINKQNEEKVESLMLNMKQKGYVTKLRGRWTLQRSAKGASFRVGSDDIENFNLKQVRQYLYTNGIDPNTLRVIKYGKKKTLILPSTAVRDMIPVSSDSSYAATIISHLMNVFPQLDVKVVDEKTAKKIYEGIADRRVFGTKFEDVRSFYHKGSAYLIEGRFSNEVAIEELMHPFVDALYNDNRELFDSLLSEARKLFPALTQQIENSYSNKKNFDIKDRQLELVTQALSRHVNKQYEDQGGNVKTFAEKFADFVKWFAETIRSIVKSFNEQGASVDATKMNNMSLSEVASMILTKDLTIDFQIKDDGPRFSLNPEMKPQVEKALAKKNLSAQQKAALESLVLNDPMQVELDEETHQYYSVETGQAFVSTTTLINGKMSDEDQKINKLNLLFGQDFDVILEDLVVGKTWDEIKGKIKNVDLAVAEKAYKSLERVIEDEFVPGDVLVPQVIIADESSGVAGMIDLLVIHEDGSMDIIDLKTSKNSSQGRNYDTGFEVTAEDSMFTGEALSSRNKHGIQVQTYKRILENKGFVVHNTKTLHYLLNIEGSGNDQVVKGFIEENFVDHLPSSNKTRVDKLVPALNVGEKEFADTQEGNKKAKEEPAQEQKFAQSNTAEADNETIAKFLSSYLEKLYTREQTLQRLYQESRGMKPKDSTLNKIHTLIQALESDMKSAQFELALGKVLRYSLEDINAFIKYVKNPENMNKQEFATVLKAYNGFIQTYELFNTAKITTRTSTKHANLLEDVKESIVDAKMLLDKAHLDYVKHLVQNNMLSQEGEMFTEQELNELIGYVDQDGKVVYGEALDMDMFEYNLGYLASSKDTLLNLVNRLMKRKQIELEDQDRLFEERLVEAGNNLVKAAEVAGVPMDQLYDFMLVKDENGRFVGRYVTKTARAYWLKKYELKDKVTDSTGKPLEYIPITDISTQKEAVEHNKKLYEAKTAYSAFNRAEKRVNGMPADGDHHRYTAEFKAVRNQYEYWTGREWVKRPGISDEEYGKYKGKYYSEPRDILVPLREKDGTYAGRTRLLKNVRFVKYDYVEPLDVSADGTSYVDAQYAKIMNPTNDLERAQKDFYEFFTKEFAQVLEGLPRDVYYKMLGKAPRVEKAFINQLKGLDGGARLKLTAKMLGKAVDVRGKTYARTAYENEDGQLSDSPPIFFTSDLRNEARVERLENELEELLADRENMSIKEFQAKRKELKSRIKSEKGKMSADEITTDLAASLLLFRKKATDYRKVIEVEDTVLAIKKIVDERAYKPSDSTASKIRTAVGKQKDYSVKGNSYVGKRLDHYMKTVMYQNGAFSTSTAQEFVTRVQALTSLTYVGFNWFGNLNNYFMGRIYNGIETAGGQFYGRKEMLNAGRAFYSEAIPGFLTGLAEKTTNGDRYKSFKGHSKYEWLVREFRIIRGMQSTEGRQDNPMWNWAYMLQEGGEYEIQSKAGIARLMTLTLTNSKTGEELSIYDAFEFDPNTGTGKLKEGFELPVEEKAKITEGIHRMNEYIQGNYAQEDQMVIQSNWIGNLVAQFHKWVYPAFQARFKQRYFDQNVGWIEGRYRTLVSFLGYMRDAQGNVVERFNDAKEELNPDQNANLLKVLAELGFFLASFGLYHAFALLRDGADDDDKYLKRVLGVLQYQMSKQQRELVTFISPVEYARIMKNPIASSRALGEIAKAVEISFVGVGVAVGVGDEKDIVYQRGDRKGTSKIVKEWSDVLPVLYTINRWKAYDTVEDFYVK
jgi:hypothetical protein